MDNPFTEIELNKFEHAFMKSQTGRPCIVIPVDTDYFYYNPEKGIASFKAIGVPVKEPTQFKTHFWKLFLKKDKLDRMTEEQKKAIPIVGNLKVPSGQVEDQQPDLPMGDSGSGDFIDPNGLPF